jgi:hypothetical protein
MKKRSQVDPRIARSLAILGLLVACGAGAEVGYQYARGEYASAAIYAGHTLVVSWLTIAANVRWMGGAKSAWEAIERRVLRWADIVVFLFAAAVASGVGLAVAHRTWVGIVITAAGLGVLILRFVLWMATGSIPQWLGGLK